MDHFAALFAHAAPTARTFFTGNLCQTEDFGDAGHLHLMQAGALRLVLAGQDDLVIDEPTLLFLPRGRPHRFVADAERGADLACATVDLGGRFGNPIAHGLPELIVMPLSRHPVLVPTCALLIAEAFGEGDGRQAALDSLFAYLLMVVVRDVMTRGLIQGGVLAGLADPRLSRALTAIHDRPRKAWTLDDLAEVVGMSRTRFAAAFKEVVGQTPIEYLTRWRMMIARGSLAKGRPVKRVAAEAGYDSAAAFSRVFARVTGESPRAFRSKGEHSDDA